MLSPNYVDDPNLAITIKFPCFFKIPNIVQNFVSKKVVGDSGEKTTAVY